MRQATRQTQQQMAGQATGWDQKAAGQAAGWDQQQAMGLAGGGDLPSQNQEQTTGQTVAGQATGWYQETMGQDQNSQSQTQQQSLTKEHGGL